MGGATTPALDHVTTMFTNLQASPCLIVLKMAGFECVFVVEPPKAVQSQCPICLLVLREPYQATCCGKSFCKECIEPVKTESKTCPTCNDKTFNLFYNKGLEQSLYDFDVYCSHKSKGCEWRGELREFDKHLNSEPPTDKSLEGCPFTVIKCPLGCASCEVALCRKGVKDHVNDKLLTYVLSQTSQLKCYELQLQEVVDVNSRLMEKLQNIEKSNHNLESRVAELEVKNKELEEEIEELKMNPPLHHMSDSNQPSSVSRQPAAVAGTSVVSEFQPPVYLTGKFKPANASFTMTQFDKHRRSNLQWYSPPFYTHPNGYKMCVRVYADGVSSGKGTHLSVYVYMMRGENDDRLKWPFTGDVTVQLLNQEEDSSHVVKTVSFNDQSSDEATSRVIGKERAGRGRGNMKILPHSALQPKYLKDDCIQLRVSKVVLY